MFESSQRVDPDTAYPELAAAIDAIPVHPDPGGTAADSAAHLRALAVLSRRLDARVHGALASFDAQGFADAQGAASTAAWWAAHAKLNRPQAGRMLAAARLVTTLPKLTEVFTAGTIGVEHLHAVAAGSRRLPDDVLALADATLRDFSGSARPAQLRQVTERLQALHDHTAVQDNAQHVHDNRSLSLARTFGDAWHLEAVLEPETGAMLAAALDSLNHRRGPDDDRPAHARNADALTDILHLALKAGELPDSGGDRPHITLLIPIDTSGGASPPDGPPSPRPPADTKTTAPDCPGAGQLLDASPT